MSATSTVGDMKLIFDETENVWKTEDGKTFDMDSIVKQVVAGDFGKQKKTYEKNLKAEYSDAVVEAILKAVDESKTDEEPVEEAPKKTKAFDPYEVAIDIHNGVYGQYLNEQLMKTKEAGITPKQLETAMEIANTIR